MTTPATTTQATATVTRYQVSTDDYTDTIEVEDGLDIDQAVREWILGGDYDSVESTLWVRASWHEICASCGEAHRCDCDRDEALLDGSVTVEIDPDEPDCADGHEHDWQSPIEVVGGIRENPGVWGHGGGVVITTVCAHCGTYRRVDTWAQDMSTGKQGLVSTSYRDADDASTAWVESMAEVA